MLSFRSVTHKQKLLLMIQNLFAVQILHANVNLSLLFNLQEASGNSLELTKE